MTMSENKHTPGPWSISRKSPHSHRAWIGAVGWGKFARVVVRMDGSARDCEDGLANARLIAAAPDLLEACEAALAAFDGSNIRLASEYVGAVGLLRDALSKAKAQGNQS
jgi:hypothetical protein